MRKQQLIQRVAQEAGLTEAVAANVVSIVLNEITESLAKGDEVNISGFGAFRVVDRASREVRNPQTRAWTVVSARRSPVFKAGSNLRRAVNDRRELSR